MFYWFMKHIVVGPILLAIFRPWVDRPRERARRRARSILASNHLSFIDSVFLPLVVDRPHRVPRQERVLHRQGPQGLGDADVLPRRPGSCRSTARAARPPRRRSTPASRVLGRRRACSASTPRAPAAPTRSSTAAAPASRAWCSRRGVPVVPVAMIDTEKVMPIGTTTPEGPPHRHRHRRAARLLAASTAWRATASCCAPSPTRSCTSCSALSGQEYVDVYASSREGATRATPSR